MFKLVISKEQEAEYKAEAERHRAEDKALFSSGKVTIKHSQTRGGYAIFVSGRMEGDLFDFSDDAEDFLKDLGITNYTVR